jgi:hypothetical protein
MVDLLDAQAFGEYGLELLHRSPAAALEPDERSIGDRDSERPADGDHGTGSAGRQATIPSCRDPGSCRQLRIAEPS